MLFKWDRSAPMPGPTYPALSPRVLRYNAWPTCLAGSSSLLVEDPSAFFSGGAGARVLLLAVLELPSF